ncbi:MAG: twin-arginine translocation protein TatA/E family subunit [Frankiales bacterium]|nr:twin-arginine translocation protein TatA/E family subunit [Frankiales bacterium]
MAGLGTTELLIIAAVIMVLFGAKRLPDSARSLGRSMRILKAETRGLHSDDADTATPSASLQAPATPAALPAAQPLFDVHTGERLRTEQSASTAPAA